LERVNLIAGKNNTGKTALLEAIFLQLGPNNPELPTRLDGFRGIEQTRVDAEEVWGWLFFGKRIDETIELLGSSKNQQSCALRIRLVEPEIGMLATPGTDTDTTSTMLPSLVTTTAWRELELAFEDPTGKVSTSRMSLSERKVSRARLTPYPPGIFLLTRRWFPADDAERFSKLEQVGRQEEVVNALKFLEPRLSRLAVLVTGGVPLIHGDIGIGRLVPLPLMGEGIVRLLSIVLAIANASGGTVLIDEVENGLHHSVLVNVWQAIAQAARQADVQVFATTHSYECILAAHEAFSNNGPYDLRLYRLERVDEDIKAVAYDQESLEVSLEEHWEIR
jgi:hypothetical protein